MRTTSLPVLAACLCIAASWDSYARTDLEVKLGGNAVARDNFYFQEQGNETAVVGVRVEPELQIARTGTLVDSQLMLGASAAKFNANSEDNYTDAWANAGADVKLGVNALNFGVNYLRGHDPFGSNRTEDSTFFDRELDIWTRTSGQVNWVRNGELRGDIFSNVGVQLDRKTYETNTDLTRFLDRSTRRYQGLVGIQLTQKTGVFLSGRLVDFSFDEDSNGPRRSGKTTAYFGGIRWSATARSRGNVRFGVASRDSEGFDTKFWEVEVDWEPILTHELKLSSSRRFDPSYRTDTEYFDTRSYEATWVHYWNNRISSRVAAVRRDRSFVGTELEDNSTNYSGKLTYEVDNELSVYGLLLLSSRDAEQNGYTYDSNAFVLGFVTRLN